MRIAVRRCLLLAVAMALAVLSVTSVVAQQDAPDDSDPPTRAARLSTIDGAVSVQPAGADDWSAATINRPLTSGDQLWSDRGSRAQIDLGAATVSLASDSSVTLLNLADQSVQLQLSAGSIIIALRDPGAAFEIDAPSAAVSLLQPGSYRIGVDDAGNTTVATRDGQSQAITRAGRSVILRGGQAAQFGASGDVDVATLAAPDDFERWSTQHARRWSPDQQSSQYVSSEVVGAQDLDSYGEWVQEPDYGYTWYPTTVAVDWAPYRYGRWLWVAPWGWTWVDNAPWGYAPFHYGRWTYLRQRWGWVPAPPGSRAVYAPAMVAWIGASGGGAALATGPAVGWLPLAPGEVYLPGHRVSPRYLRNVNVSNTVIINSDYIVNVSRNPALQYRYANRDAPRALSVVSQRSFTSGKPIAAQLIAPPPQWQGVEATPRPPAIVPTRHSVLGTAAQSPVSRPPLAIANRPVVARHPSSPAPGPSPEAAPAPMPMPMPMPTPNVRASPGRPLMPDRHVMPVTPVTPAAAAAAAALPATSATVRGSSAPPAPPAPSASFAPPIDRRAIPERYSFERAPLPASREVAPPAPPPLPAQPPPPPNQPPPPGQPPSRGRPAPQGVRPEVR